jgi:hypothetical protein
VYETWTLTIWEEHKLRVFESRVLRKVFGLKRDEVTEDWNIYVMRSLMISTPHQSFFG